MKPKKRLQELERKRKPPKPIKIVVNWGPDPLPKQPGDIIIRWDDDPDEKVQDDPKKTD